MDSITYTVTVVGSNPTFRTLNFKKPSKIVLFTCFQEVVATRYLDKFGHFRSF